MSVSGAVRATTTVVDWAESLITEPFVIGVTFLPVPFFAWCAVISATRPAWGKEGTQVAADLKPVYRAATAVEAEMNLDQFIATWGHKHKAIGKLELNTGRIE